MCAPKEGEGRERAAYALLAGTVYRPPGFALRGVKVLIEPEQPNRTGLSSRKRKPLRIRVANGPSACHLYPPSGAFDVKVNGYRPEQRSVSVEGEQRVDSSIVLEPLVSPTPSKEATP